VNIRDAENAELKNVSDQAEQIDLAFGTEATLRYPIQCVSCECDTGIRVFSKIKVGYCPKLCTYKFHNCTSTVAIVLDLCGRSVW